MPQLSILLHRLKILFKGRGLFEALLVHPIHLYGHLFSALFAVARLRYKLVRSPLPHQIRTGSPNSDLPMTFVHAMRPMAARLSTVVLLVGWVGACEREPTGIAPVGLVDLASPWDLTTPGDTEMNEHALFLVGEAGTRIDRMRSLVVVRNGKLAYERYYHGATVDSLADVRSVTTSVLGALVGIAVESRYLDGIDQPITDFLDPSSFDIRPEHKFVTVGQLLTMASGLYWSSNNLGGYGEWIQSDMHVDYLLSRDFTSTPGESFTYNPGAVHLLSVVLEEAVGRPLQDFADEVLFRPLGIGQRSWERISSGYVNGSSGLDLRPRDLARIGQLYLQDGWSGTTSIVPERWVAETVQPQWPGLGSVGPVQDLSYGYLWWLDEDNEAFFAWGFAGQFIYVVPAHQLIVVATTDWQGVSEDVGSSALEEDVLGLIVHGVLSAAR
jgi:CubicO group peptidase (beta-lactamase class C family)